MTRFLKALLLAPLLYLAAGALGGAWPVNTGWREPRDGVTIWVVDNGWHTGIVLPARTSEVDWTGLVRADHLPDPRYAGTWLWFGWGDRDFYLDTPHWSDLRASTLTRAAIGSPRTLVHVDHTNLPPDQGRAIRLSRAQYIRLAAALRASFAGGPPIRGYGAADVFYPGTGRYDLVRTCNWWTGRMLAQAGVRIGLWTPFSATVMQWF